MKKTLSISFIMMLMAFGCKKDNESPDTGSKDTYQPVTKGSYWKYNGLSTGTVFSTITMTGATMTLKGHIYYEHKTVLEQSGTESAGYFNSENGEVRSSAGNSESLFLKENAAIGETWVSAIVDGSPSGPIYQEPYKVIAKIVERGINYTVAGKTYTNVIHTKHMRQFSSGATTDLYDYYIAKGVGMIERKNPDGSSSTALLEYSIK